MKMQKLGFGCIIIKKTASFADDRNTSLKIGMNDGIPCLQGVSGEEYSLPNDTVLFPESSMLNATIVAITNLASHQVSREITHVLFKMCRIFLWNTIRIGVSKSLSYK